MTGKLSFSISISLALCGPCAAARGQSATAAADFRPHDLRSPERAYEFTSLVFKLRSVKQVTGRATGFGGGPGEFFKLSEQFLRYGTAEDFKRLSEDENAIVRVMGLVCLALSDAGRPEGDRDAAPLVSRFGDRSPVRLFVDCIIYDTTVGDIARRLLADPNFLGHGAKRHAPESEGR